MKKNIIIFAAHPDDELLGCGGTIKLLSKKNNVIVVFFTTGITSRNTKNANISINKLKIHSEKSAKILGIKSIIFLDLQDNKLDTYPRLEIIQRIEKIINNFKPSKIFTHHFSDLNIDHEIVSKSVITACRPNHFNKYLKQIYLFETLSNTEWSIQRKFQPNVYMDISKTINFKIRAMKEYKTELQKKPMPRSIEIIKTLAKLRGSEINVNFAESFYLFREII